MTDMLIYLILAVLSIIGILYAVNRPKDSPSRILNLALAAVLALIPLSVGAVKLFSGLKFPEAAAKAPAGDAKFDAEKTMLVADMTNLAPIMKTIASVGEDRYNDIASDGELYESYRNRSMNFMNTVNEMVKKYETTAFESKLRDKVSDLTNLLKNAQTAARNFKGVFYDENGADYGTYISPASRALTGITAVTNGL